MASKVTVTKKRCKHCGNERIIRIDEFDAEACRNCMRWTEPGCSDPKCDFCSARPPTPNGVNWDDPNNTCY